MQIQGLWRELWGRLREKGAGREIPSHRPSEGDWTHGKAGLTAVPGQEDNDVLLLDTAFLERTFKQVHFPADRELVLRYVDMEQDFAYGQDRTINLHNLISRLDPECFASRKALLSGIHRCLDQGRAHGA